MENITREVLKEREKRSLTPNALLKGISIQVFYDEVIGDFEFKTFRDFDGWKEHDGVIQNEKPYGAYSYYYTCINECPVYKIDYDDEEEINALGMSRESLEKRVLVSPYSVFKKTNITKSGNRFLVTLEYQKELSQTNQTDPK